MQYQKYLHIANYDNNKTCATHKQPVLSWTLFLAFTLWEWQQKYWNG